ncbi:MAG: ketose-bisphosphate aldolase [Bacillota bacterium]|jgi:fructose-bisphosphate aldolase class II|nr:ketose-bisphosphate aldolase [Bacillota bacterium]MDI9415092.1 ketose-bisphosphate aldolase [Bacillota bacterium]NLD13155.1 ketose-bisphosphate aldolase [Bacillota bacterium]HCD42107.1 tagatose-bisphosphate aldolase [Bacillota bacterium]HOB89174.1 ketose-bisphosphate aldolase [Bacillota bacterium]
MPLVTSKEVLTKAQREGYAVGAFNANNLEYVQAIIDAAEEEKAPVILQASQGAINYAGLDMIVAMVRTAAEKATVPVVLHLDHGTSYEQNVRCLRAGFTSLMFDGSKLPYEENAAITKRIVEMAHVVGVPVEAELGQVPTAGNITWEDVEALMTDPEEAKRFVEETGVDFLAVAVGSVHKMTAQAAKIDVERTKKIAELTGVPLVLHGASGVTDDGYKEGIKAGICKINIATELNKAFTKGMHDALAKKPDEIDPRRIVGVGRQYVKEAVKAKMRLFGCSGKA